MESDMSEYDNFLNELNNAVRTYHKFKSVGIDLAKLSPTEPVKMKVKSKPVTTTTAKSTVVKKQVNKASNTPLESTVVKLLKSNPMKPSDLFEKLKDQDHGIKLKQLPGEISSVLSSLKKKNQVKRLEDKTYQLV